MALPFSYICDLLEALYNQCIAGKHALTCETIRRWFHHHRQVIESLDSHNGAALLSTLLPARRTDRVYAIQAHRLEKIFARSQRLGASRISELHRYRVPGSGVDLADCIFAILKVTPNPTHHVTILEIDNLLNAVAAAIAFSSPAVRSAGGTISDSHRNGLESVYMRLTPLEAKWFTRLVLKDFRPIEIDEAVVLQSYHPVLPCIMKVLDHFCPAVALLERASKSSEQVGAVQGLSRRAILQHLKPTLGTKVGRPFWRKGRSIKHCLDIGHGRMSVEKKIDGEYCQVHVDLSLGRNCIQIFSKSGKDSTADRSRLHRTIRESLDIGQSTCKITKGCILEGELVVYSDYERKVLPFHKIRNHVTRSGRYMNSEMDSPPRAYEHLMIIYYDVLLVDDESLLGVRHSERFERLKRTIVTRQGHAEIVDRHVIDLGTHRAASDLRNLFAKAILAREEGLVLKPDDPFINLDRPGDFCGSPIKLKKEYIGNFGDVGDFAVVGARYDPSKAKCYQIPGLEWTHFYIACATSKGELYAAGVVPEFTVVAVVELNETMLKTVVTHSQPFAVSARDNHTLKLTIPTGLAQGKCPSIIFTRPLVFDIRCFSFDKEGNVDFYTPRFPAVSKVHFDRDYRSAMTFPELQELAAKATMEKPWEDRDSQELLGWLAALEGADPRGIAVDRVTQQTASTAPTPSPRPGRANSERPLSVVPSSAGSRKGSSQVSYRSAPMSTPPTSLPVGPPSSQQAPDTTLLVENAKDHLLDAKTPLPHQTGRNILSLGENHSPSQSKSQLSSPRSFKAPSARVIQSPPTTTTPSPRLDQVPPQSPLATASLCPIAGSNCQLHNRPILLSPSIAARNDITKTMLPRHGINSYITDHVSWDPENVDRPDTWKICLVDMDDRERTLGFLAGIEGRPLKTKRGREYIEIYDWRVLESVRDVEEGGQGLEGFDPFRRWFVGLV
ncbi:uncharacterized protein DNG_01139 [Cephalotrichum gorgonifer]|uniref:ATP-dependent DNA ligase family profile domain-containing protein n=1 Tax=Cephalotrichum gorgonifer TaxID=2041049 RepID=A0AAE8MSH3_9PEZI|nr:uncharacterized protein DNG_01139 [Cephalotrichum gorgonifer]